MSAQVVHWTEIARVAKELLADRAHGEKDKALAEAVIAVKQRWPWLTIAKQTLRTALNAASLLEEIERNDPEHARTLMQLPAISVETLSRWHRYDPAGARWAAEAYASDLYSVRSLMDAERGARLFHRSAETGRSGRLMFEGNVSEQIARSRDPVSGSRVDLWFQYGSSPVNPELVPPVILAKVSAVGHLSVAGRTVGCAVLVAGPYAEPTVSPGMLADWLLRAQGLAAWFGHVALLVGNALESDAVDLLRAWAAGLRSVGDGTASSSVIVLEPFGLEAADSGKLKSDQKPAKRRRPSLRFSADRMR